MDSPRDLSGSDRDDNHQRPVTPSGNEDLQPYSDVGLGILTTPPRVQRPASAASRRSAGYSPGSNASLSSGRESDDADWNKQANSQPIISIPQNVVPQNQFVGGLSDKSEPLRGLTNVPPNDFSVDENVQAQHHNGHDNNKGSTWPRDSSTLLELEKLHIDNAALERQLKALEVYCELQQREIEACRENQIAAEQLAESRRQEVVEIRRSKEHIDKELAESETQVQALERENASLRLLHDEKHQRNKAEWELGNLYGELEQKKTEVSSLSDEVQKLRGSKRQSEKAQRKSEEECKKLHEQIKRTFVWIQEAQKQQAQKDMEQFRLEDEHFLSFRKRRPSTTGDSVRTTSEQQENLGDFISSRPQSVTSQSLASSARLSFISEIAFQKSHTCVCGATSPPASGTVRQARHARHALTASHFPPSASKRVSFRLDPTPSHHKGPGASVRRQSYPSFRKGRHRKTSLLRNSSVPGGEHQDEPTRANHGRRSTTTFEADGATEGRTVTSRSLSLPITQEEHAKLREALQSTTPLRIVWDNSRNQAVFEPEPITVAVGMISAPKSALSGMAANTLSIKGFANQDSVEQAPEEIMQVPLSQVDADSSGLHALKKSPNGNESMPMLESHDNVTDEGDLTQEGTLRPGSIGTVQEVPAAASPPASKAQTSISPSRRPGSSSVRPVEDGTGTSSAIEYPPSPGLRRRLGGTSSTTFSIQNLEPIQSASLSPIPLYHVWAYFTSARYEIVKKIEGGGSRTGFDNISKIPVQEPASSASPSKMAAVPGNRWLISSLGRIAIVKALTIPAIIILCSLVLVACYTNMLLLKTPRLFGEEPLKSLGSSTSIRTCPPYLSVMEGFPPEAYLEQPEMGAKTEEATAWPTAPWMLTSTETETLTEFLTKTYMRTRTRIHIETETKTQTVMGASATTLTKFKTETMTVFLALPSPLPPTRSLRIPIRTSGSEQNSTIPSAAGPVPGALPSLELYGNKHCVCSCPSTLIYTCEKPNATSLRSSQLLRPQRNFGPTADEIDERAKKARQRSLRLQQIYTGPTYWGLLPSVKQQLEILQLRVLEVLLGGVWDPRGY
ncbi:uncharacterized protein PV07_04892 [Cladophialophora immunda]|uniref:Uncharacterized protein n=1 Tax=Cladophialophora immunda TaxID=569365 RepID=A0A0D1ZM91_9EURO|nr:uncharacterized protein PV07_04892 [Cladophialophora immunda]KIW29046.1 hypothetical protein PV07_04892 [Cladophialophora immunda]